MTVAMPKKTSGLRRRGAKWYGRWIEAGKKRERCLGPNLAAAQRCLAKIKVEAMERDSGLGFRTEQAAPLAPLVEAYLAAQAPRWRPKYLHEVREALGEMLDGIQRVADLTAGRVEASRDAAGGSARTRNKKATWVLGFVRWLRRTGQGNPPLLAIAPVPRADVRRRRSMTRSEVSALVVHGGRVADLIALLAGTGLRLDEALRLRWRDLTQAGIYVSTSKNGDARTVPIAGELRARLLRAKAARGADDDGPVIVGARGQAMVAARAGRWLLERLREALRLAGVAPAGVDWHAFRHTYATWAADAGASSSQMMALLGWRTIAMAERYVHREALDLNALVLRVGQTVGNGEADRENAAGIA